MTLANNHSEPEETQYSLRCVEETANITAGKPIDISWIASQGFIITNKAAELIDNTNKPTKITKILKYIQVYNRYSEHPSIYTIAKTFFNGDIAETLEMMQTLLTQDLVGFVEDIMK